MEYKELIRAKNNAIAISILISIVMRAIANAFFTSGIMVVAFVVAGLFFSGTLYLLNRKVNPFVMMYLIVALMSFLCISLMIAFPCTTNYLMFFMSIFFIVIYEDIRPIILQCAISMVGMIAFYFMYQQKLAETWSPDAMVMCVVYIASGMIVYIFLCKFSKHQIKTIEANAKKSDKARKQAEELLVEIGKSVDSLGQTSDKISSSVTVTGEISTQIAEATEDVARRTASEVDDTDNIKNMVQESVEQISEVAESSDNMAKASRETGRRVEEGGYLVRELTDQMISLDGKMNQIAEAINVLNDENKKIVTILGTLDEITDQTNLLSLNASIEAARAGEHGKGFAVVASEIRALSENSAQFTNEIHSILEGIEHQTEMVKNEIESGLAAVETCAQNTKEVDNTFSDISENTSSVLTQAVEIEKKAQALNALLTDTLSNVNNVSDNIESTSAAMEEVSASISNLNGNISEVVDGYNNINGITNVLIQVSSQEEEPVEEVKTKKKWIDKKLSM